MLTSTEDSYVIHFEQEGQAFLVDEFVLDNLNAAESNLL